MYIRLIACFYLEKRMEGSMVTQLVLDYVNTHTTAFIGCQKIHSCM